MNSGDTSDTQIEGLISEIKRLQSANTGFAGGMMQHQSRILMTLVNTQILKLTSPASVFWF